MFGKVKKILGIEGVKVTLQIPEKISIKDKTLTGLIELTSLSDNQEVTEITIQLLEKYSRGRGDKRLVNEYILGKTILREKLQISKGEWVQIPFVLDFIYADSEMDRIGNTNFFTKQIVALAKKIKDVQSEYRVILEAKCKDTTLHPFDEKYIELV